MEKMISYGHRVCRQGTITKSTTISDDSSESLSELSGNGNRREKAYGSSELSEEYETRPKRRLYRRSAVKTGPVPRIRHLTLCQVCSKRASSNSGLECMPVIPCIDCTFVYHEACAKDRATWDDAGNLTCPMCALPEGRECSQCGEQVVDNDAILFRCKACTFACHPECLPRLHSAESEQDDHANGYMCSVRDLRSYVKHALCPQCFWSGEVDVLLVFRETFGPGKQSEQVAQLSRAETRSDEKNNDDSDESNDCSSETRPSKGPPVPEGRCREILVKHRNSSYHELRWLTESYLAYAYPHKLRVFWKKQRMMPGGPRPQAVGDVVNEDFFRIDCIIAAENEDEQPFSLTGNNGNWMYPSI